MKSSSKSTDYYGLKVLFTLGVLLLLLAYASFYLMQNYYSKSFLEYGLSGKKIYFLQSNTVKEMHLKNGMDYEAYEKRINYFQTICLEQGYKSSSIIANNLKDVDRNAKLVVLDAMSLSRNEIEDIDTFVVHGGRLLFNFTSGFLSPSLHYQSDNLVSRITGLQVDKDINTIKYDRNSTGYTSTRLMSPLTEYLPEGQALELAIYDPLPIYNVPNNIEADAYLTNWSQTNYMQVGKKLELNRSQSGLIWHGYKKSGKWVYFSFPSYSFLEANIPSYKKLFQGMLEYLDKQIIPVTYPYIDAKNAIFLSEDTEYKFENLKQLYDVAEKNKFPVTAFCVANLAMKDEKLMELVSKSKYMEIGSHSYTHKKIVGESDEVYVRETQGAKKELHRLSKQSIYGFRPPREEIDEKMIGLLADGGFEYILAAEENRLTPYMEGSVMKMLRHGTDDYSYLVNLDWDSKQILQEMKHQANVLADLDGIYTMSVHTHLMAFSSNINIVDKFFQYVNSQNQMVPMNGKMVADRVYQRKNIHFEMVQTEKKILMTINNENAKEVKNLHFDFFVDSDITIKSIESEIIGLDIDIKQISLRKYTLIINSLKPRSEVVLFVNYEKHN